MKWNSQLYDQQHAFVSTYGTEVLAWLDPQPNESILDVGCGTGDLTKQIADHGSHVIGTDYSADMVAAAQKKYPSIDFRQINGEELPFDNEFDAIFSNATFHWIKDQEALIKGLYASLKPNGRLIVEFGGKGNVASMQQAIRQASIALGLEDFVDIDFWYFPSITAYSTLLEKHGFEVQEAYLFDRPTTLKGEDGMLKWIEQFGVNAFTNLTTEQTTQLKKRAVELLRPDRYIQEEWIADYRRIRIKAIKI